MNINIKRTDFINVDIDDNDVERIVMESELDPMVYLERAKERYIQGLFPGQEEVFLNNSNAWCKRTWSGTALDNTRLRKATPEEIDVMEAFNTTVNTLFQSVLTK